jgi:hypothetical protein
VPEDYKRHGRSLGAVEFRSSKGTVEWSEVIEAQNWRTGWSWQSKVIEQEMARRLHSDLK